ncbi:tRNA pseudouridine synthase D [Pseudovirgaria hyperparasitica]|uniref:tRNA pseudouridine synthase D n=1 Tax=Pseudovirgaria hyperparasitica TaxID=470096 RepID=A0A6A6W2U1_9PEZI|nr:tRNA pseudouridine synthase D [Pseudovirgaria hyperparasitica]KAF2757172.1 tRNA pseudouridine synthase D [Pseudovirgaria hyperparasitica]
MMSSSPREDHGPPSKRARLSPSAPSLHPSQPDAMELDNAPPAVATKDTAQLDGPEPRLVLDTQDNAPQPTAESQVSNRAQLEKASEQRLVTTHTTAAIVSKESRVGITQYVVPDTRGFEGVLKQRYTDFLVNEILPDGEVCHLTSLGDEKLRDRIEGLMAEKVREESAQRERHLLEIEEKKRQEAKKQEQEAKAAEELKQAETKESEVLEETQATDEAVATNGSNEGPDSNGDTDAKHEQGTNDEKPDEASVVHDSKQISADNILILNDLFGDRTAGILKLNNSVLKHPDWKARDFSQVKVGKLADKAQRTRAHQAIRDIFSGRLESLTENDGSMVVKAMPPSQRGNDTFHGGRGGRGGRGNRGGRGGRGGNSRSDGRPEKPRGKLGWAELGGEYLHFTLYKENKDTMESIAYLASQMKVPAKSFQFAGTKDRRGVTVQRVCVRRAYADQLSKHGKLLRQAKIGDFEYQPNGLDLGDLTGNEFVITLRDCSFSGAADLPHDEKAKVAEDIIKTAVANLNRNGFLNYYGLQRFGTFAATTDEIGVKMLQEDFRGAVDKILDFDPALLDIDRRNQSSTPVATDDLDRALAINIWRTTGKGYEALGILPRKFSAEAAVIRHLAARGHENDLQGALQTISRPLRLMYVHAYQSLVWNVVASKRWELYGGRVVEGDLVLVHEHKDKEKDSEPIAPIEDFDQAGEEVVLPAAEDRATGLDDVHERARALNKEEAESGQYSIFDVVLSLPGWDVEYPANAIGEFYKEFMASERGGGLNPHDMRRGWKEVSLSGGYRKLLGKVGDGMTGEVKSYSSVDEQLVETDLDRLFRERNLTTANDRQNLPKAGDDELTKKIAVIIRMKLGSSTYATMALRELMKAGGVKTYKPEYSGRA